jgi:hypothetical protein
MRANVRTLVGLAALLGLCTQARLVVATPKGPAGKGTACVTLLSDRHVLLGYPAHRLKAALTDIPHRKVVYLGPPTTRCAGAASGQHALERSATGVAVLLVREPGMVLGNMVTSVGVWEIIRAPARYRLVALVKGDGSSIRAYRSRSFSRGRLLGLKLPVVLERVRGALPIPDLRSLRSLQRRSAGRS